MEKIALTSFIALRPHFLIVKDRGHPRYYSHHYLAMVSLLVERSAKSSLLLCRSCRTAKLQARFLSSASTLMLGPESPNFIDVPRSLQPDFAPKPRVKGILP